MEFSIRRSRDFDYVIVNYNYYSEELREIIKDFDQCIMHISNNKSFDLRGNTSVKIELVLTLILITN